MACWQCCKCEKPMEVKDLSLIYYEMLGFQSGLECPGCKIKFITEEVAMEMNKTEAEMEAKFG